MPVVTGSVTALWRWPVLAMAGEALQSTLMDEHGLAGDRLHRLDSASGPLVAADVPALERWSASFPFHRDAFLLPHRLPPPNVTGPGHRSWTWGDPRLKFALEEDLGRPVELIRDLEAEPGVVLAAGGAPKDPARAGVNVLVDLELAGHDWDGAQVAFAGGARLRLVTARADGPGMAARVEAPGRLEVGERVRIG